MKLWLRQKIKMKTFVCSDTHFGHANIVRYCERPFRDVHHMGTELVRRWNEPVSNDDTVYFIGDFAMGPKVDEEFIVSVLSSLNFKTMYVVLGNHDQPNKKYKQKGLKRIVDDNSLDRIEILPDIFELAFKGKKFVMCHYPMKDWDGKFHGSVHLHGHCHGRALSVPPETVDESHTQYANGVWAESTVPAIDNRYDIGVDMYGGPVELTGDLRFLNSPKGWHEKSN